MIRLRQTLFLVVCLAAIMGILFACSLGTHVSDGRTPDEHRRIAEACLSMLHSSLTNEADIKPDDPRVPEVIRALQPIEIVVRGTDVVIMRAGRPGEYHFSHRPHDARPWVLYVAGPGYRDHQELLRLEHE